jgi:endonuclease VIII
VPEGDTIHRIATTLRVSLGDVPVRAFETAPYVRGPRPEAGETIDSIEARGKHVLMRFDGGATLHSHLGMDGTWRVTTRGPGAHPRAGGRPGAGVVVRVETARAAAVCADTAAVELLDDAGVRRHPVLSALGPDLCDAEVDLEEAQRRMDALLDPATPIGEALLDQRVAGGIGNVYRSEALWACRVDPFVAVGEVPAATRGDLLVTASRLLRGNLVRGGPRRTVAQGLAVYERGGRRCRRCDGTVTSRRLGERARTVWWCPLCQTGP